MAEQDCKLRLSKVRIRNFINFKDVELDFKDDNVFQFVGCNGSGKTSILEAIRRCTESKSNHSFSTIPNKDETSFVICTFEGNITEIISSSNKHLDENTQGISKDKADNPPKMRKAEACKLISIYISWHRNCSIRNVIKTIVFNQNGDIGTEMIRTVQSELGEIRWVPYHKHLKKEVIEKIIREDCDFRFIEEEIIDQKLLEMDFNEITRGGAEFDNKFRELVKIEFFYPFRGISKIQCSEQMPNVTSEDHFRSGTERSFILTQFLKNQNEYDLTLEQEIFKRLTPDDDYSFQFTGKESAKLLEVKDSMASSAISVLKTPVGVLEAKHLSITLAKKRSGIIIIEEPGRGMHPDMVRRMIYLVFQDRDIMFGKIVIITTHDKNFLTPFTIKNTFLCKKRIGGTREVKPLADVEMDARRKKKSSMEVGTQRQSSIDEDKFHERESVECRFLAGVVFSQRIIFLEGESDFTLIETIKQLLITKTYLRKMYLEALESEYEQHNSDMTEGIIIQFLASMNVEMMNGVKNMKRINDMCYSLDCLDNLFFLVDYDVLGTIDKTLSLDFTNLEWFNLQILESNGVFVWDNDAVESISNTNNTEDKGVQCPGILKQDKVTGAGVPPKAGSLEDVITRFSLEHDKAYHSGNDTCCITNCDGLVKLLREKKILEEKNYPSLFTIDKSKFEISVGGEIEIDEKHSQFFTGMMIQEDESHQTIQIQKQIVQGKIVINGEGKFKTCKTGDVDIFHPVTKETEEKVSTLYTVCDGKAFSFSPINHENDIKCKEDIRISIRFDKNPKSQSGNKKGKAIYEGRFEISFERERHNGDLEMRPIKCTKEGSISIEEKPQYHRKLCMTEKFLLQNTLTHSDVLQVVETFLKCSIKYREGQIWRFLRFLADKALNRRTKINLRMESGRYIQTVQVTD